MIKLKKNAPFRSCISKISITLIDNAEDLLISIQIYNLLEYSQNYFMTSGSLWNFYRDEIHDVDDNTLNGKSFEYKTKLCRKYARKIWKWRRCNRPPVPTLYVEVTIPLKYFGNFWKSLDSPLINCEMEIDLWWKKTVYW